MPATQPDRATQNDNTDEDSDFVELKKITPGDITIAIFCALPYESVAVKYSLDEEFEFRQALGPQKYVFSFGRIGEHNVVIARPSQMGTVNAGQCAATVSQQFPKVRLALMVGIGAGIPSSKNDIRLGDIAVSIPRDNHPGVIQYDFGKYEPDGEFVRKGSLNTPPRILISADGSLEEDEIMEKKPLRKTLRHITKQLRYKRPSSSDVLFEPTFHHVRKGSDCGECETSSEKRVVTRSKRDVAIGQSVVHRGLILSGSGVVKNPEDRDRLRRGYEDAICFEMEAAGIMNEIPCLVIRGICDYADTHKQDGWHYYASAVAAAYCKAVLVKVHGYDVEETTSMKEAIDKLHLKISGLSNTLTNLEQNTNNGINSHILNWLTSTDYGPQQSDFFKRRQQGTGEWFLASEPYLTWLNQGNQTLFCPGIPGAGKTIITSIVINDLLDRFRNEVTVGIAYIYFNFRRNDEQDISHLLASILKQLVQGQSSLPEGIQKLYNTHETQRTRPSDDEILQATRSVATTYSQVFVILDALDECQITDARRSKFLSVIFNLQTATEVNLFATSRPIQDIKQQFQDCITQEILASDGDIGRYVQGHMSELPGFILGRPDIQQEIKEGIIKAVNGMFLLAQLYFDSLQDKISARAMKDALAELQEQSVGLATKDKKLEALSKAYKDAMKRIERQGEGFQSVANRVLSWITYAQRPLRYLEVQHALAVRPSDRRFDKEGLPGVEDMVSVCAGLVTIDDESGVIRLVHYTTQEYFEMTRSQWFPEAQFEITSICTTYLSFQDFGTGPCQSDIDYKERLSLYPLYDYAAHNWGHHARATSSCPNVVSFLEREPQVEASSQALLASKEWCFDGWSQLFSKKMTGLHMAAYFGLGEAARILFEAYGVDIRDSYGQKPLSLAAENGHKEVVQLLLEKGADIETKDSNHQTPLLYAVENGYKYIVQVLLEKGADIKTKDSDGWTPLLRAARNGHKDVVQLLLEKGADIEAKDRARHTPLLRAAVNGHKDVVQLLLEKGADIETKGSNGWTPLLRAAMNGHKDVVQLLLEKGADIETRDSNGWTPLSWAARKWYDDVVQLLLEKGADIETKDSNGWTPLSWAAEYGCNDVVQLLLEKGADIETKDKSSQTPLLKKGVRLI